MKPLYRTKRLTYGHTILGPGMCSSRTSGEERLHPEHVCELLEYAYRAGYADGAEHHTPEPQEQTVPEDPDQTTLF